MAARMIAPRYWKKLDRHPLGGEYPDLEPAVKGRMVEVLKERGVANRRKVTLYEGQVLDGWQMYLACLEAGIKPEFAPLPKGWTAEEFVEAMNDLRRHETPEQAREHAEARRRRVAEAHQAGASTRTIAASEGVSQTTVRRDLNGEAPAAEVKGADGKTYKSQFCERCQRVGPVKGCAECAALKKKKPREPGDDTDSEREAKQAAKDNGKVIFDRKAFEADYGAIVRQITALAKPYGLHNSPKAEGLRRLLGEWKAQFDAFKDELAKSKR